MLPHQEEYVETYLHAAEDPFQFIHDAQETGRVDRALIGAATASGFKRLV
jgi:hypothetical protein